MSVLPFDNELGDYVRKARAQLEHQCGMVGVARNSLAYYSTGPTPHQILKRTLQLLASDFPAVLLPSIDALGKHIAQRNRECVLKRRDKRFISVTGISEYVAQPTMDAPTVVQPVTNNISEAVLQATVNKMVTEALGSTHMLLNDMMELVVKLDATNTAMAQRIRELLDTPRKQAAPAIPKRNPPVVDSDPPDPNPSDQYTDATPEVYCKGPSWRDIQKEELSHDEQKWRGFVPWYVKHYTGGVNRIRPPGLIVFGWYPTRRVLQTLFYRLAVESVYWIHTYNKAKLVARQAERIQASEGHFAVLLAPNDTIDATAFDTAVHQCSHSGIPYYRVHGKNIHTDSVIRFFRQRLRPAYERYENTTIPRLNGAAWVT